MIHYQDKESITLKYDWELTNSEYSQNVPFQERPLNRVMTTGLRILDKTRIREPKELHMSNRVK